MRGRRRFALLGLGMVIGLTIASAGTAVAAKPAQNAHQRTLAYWTASRIAHAKPRDFLRAPGGEFEKGPHRDAKPPRPGGGGGNVTGASWTKGGQIQVKSGKVVFTLNSGDYICSGTVVNDNQASVSIVLTAGHCGYDGQDGGFARNWMFIPNFDGAPTYTCASTIYGCWTARALVLDSGFTTAGGFNTQATKHDWTFAVVPAGGKSNTQLDATVGSFPISFSTASGHDLRLRLSGGRQVQRQRSHVLQGHAGERPVQRQRDDRDGVRHDRRLVRRTLARGLQRDVRRGHAERPELLRLLRDPQHVRPEVQREHPGHVRPREHGADLEPDGERQPLTRRLATARRPVGPPPGRLRERRR